MSDGKVRVSLQENKEFDERFLSPVFSASYLKLKPSDLQLEVSWDSKDLEHKPCRDEIKLVQKAIRTLQIEDEPLITVEYEMDGCVFTASLSMSPTFRSVMREVVPEPIVRLEGSLDIISQRGYMSCQTSEEDFTADFKCSDEICTEDETNGIKICKMYEPSRKYFDRICTTIAFSIELEWIRTVTSAKLDLNKIGNYLFENDASKDFTVVVENGNEIKCHGFMLGASSPVFDRMLSYDMKESASKRIVIEDVSEETFQMFLNYVYGKEVLFSSMDCHQFLDLFHVAHRYDVEGLEDSIEKALRQKKTEWFAPDVIVELYFLARNVQKLNELREKLLIIMGRMAEKELRNCNAIQTLSKEETDALFNEISKVRGKKKEDETEEEEDDETEEEDDETDEEEDEMEEQIDETVEEEDETVEEQDMTVEKGTKRKDDSSDEDLIYGIDDDDKNHSLSFEEKYQKFKLRFMNEYPDKVVASKSDDEDEEAEEGMDCL